MPARLISLFCAALALFFLGCAAPLQDAARALDAVAVVARTAEPVMDAQYRSDNAACMALPKVADAEVCVAKVREQWKPARDAYRAVRAAWLGADAALRLAEAAHALGKSADMATVLARGLDALAALSRFQTAMEQLSHPSAAPMLPAPSALPKASP